MVSRQLRCPWLFINSEVFMCRTVWCYTMYREFATWTKLRPKQSPGESKGSVPEQEENQQRFPAWQLKGRQRRWVTEEMRLDHEEKQDQLQQPLRVTRGW